MKAPKWAAWVAVAVCLPVISLPWLIAACPPGLTYEALLWLYAPVIILAAYCAYKSMPERPEVFWVLIAIVILTHLAMWVLVNPMYLSTLLR